MTRLAPAALLAALTLAGCSASTPRAPDPGPAPIAPEPDPGPPDRTSAPPPFAPPPARGPGIDAREALDLARRYDEPQDAIGALDRRRFAFPLDDPTLAWFGGQGLAPEVLDYLRKRARVDWEAMRGDVDEDEDR